MLHFWVSVLASKVDIRNTEWTWLLVFCLLSSDCCSGWILPSISQSVGALVLFWGSSALIRSAALNIVHRSFRCSNYGPRLVRALSRTTAAAYALGIGAPARCKLFYELPALHLVLTLSYLCLSGINVSSLNDEHYCDVIYL